jgi:hypothetical protein
MAVRKKYGKSVKSKDSEITQVKADAQRPVPTPPLPRPRDVRFPAEAATLQSKRLLAPGTVAAKSKRMAPLARGPRRLLTNPRRFHSLLASVTLDMKRQTQLAKSIHLTVREFDRLRAVRVRTLTKSAGAPNKDEIRFLVSRLLTSFYHYSDGKPVTRHYQKDKGSAASLFLRAVLEDLGIADSDSWIKKHLGEKKTLEADGFVKTFGKNPTPGVPPILV